jgi:hypothetical protein
MEAMDSSAEHHLPVPSPGRDSPTISKKRKTINKDLYKKYKQNKRN